MIPSPDNRAASALFRAFGGPARLKTADVNRPATGRGLHRLEMVVLSTLVPLVAAAALLERLVAWCGPWVAAGLLLPALFLGLQTTACLIGPLARACASLGGHLESWRWRLWALLLGAWSVWAVRHGGWPASFGWAWLLLLAGNGLAMPVLAWRAAMRLPGRAGITTRLCLAVVCHLPLAWFASRGQVWPAVASGAIVAALWCRGTLSARSTLFGPVIDHLHRRGVWLTIDDGPDPETTPALLDLLDARQAKATFFVIGGKVRAHPELTKEILRRGHTLGNHTETHPARSFWCAGPGRSRREIEFGSRSIREVTGVEPRWFRAPVGHRNFFTHPVTLQLGMHVVAWTRRGLDGVSTNVPAILARLLDGVRDGEILVVHDSTPVAADVLRGVLDGLAERGIPPGPAPMEQVAQDHIGPSPAA